MRLAVARALASVSVGLLTAGWVAVPLPAGATAASPPPPATAQPEQARLERELLRQTGGTARLARPHGTGQARLLGATRAHPVPRPRGLAADAAPETAARAHLSAYGGLLGIADESRDLRLK